MTDSKLRGVLLDLDGVVFVGDTAIPGAADALNQLRAQGLTLRFLTNNSTRSSEKLHSDMVAIGLPIERAEIINTPKAASLYLKQFDNPSLYLVLTDNAKQDFFGFKQSDTKPDFIVMGDIYNGWSYDLLDKIFNMMITGSQLIALHKGRYWLTQKGLQVDVGLFVAGLEYVTGHEAVVLGKPSKTFFELALADAGMKASEVVMVGDDIDTDIGGAQAVGIPGVLVKTGKYRQDLVAKSSVRPAYVVESIAGLPKLLAT